MEFGVGAGEMEGRVPSPFPTRRCSSPVPSEIQRVHSRGAWQGPDWSCTIEFRATTSQAVTWNPRQVQFGPFHRGTIVTTDGAWYGSTTAGRPDVMEFYGTTLSRCAIHGVSWSIIDTKHRWHSLRKQQTSPEGRCVMLLLMESYPGVQ